MNWITRVTQSLEGVIIALDQIRANKVRAGLTILGIAVGVFVVVLIAAAVHGINNSVAHDFERAGPTTFRISRFPITFEACDGTDDTCKWLHNPPLTLADAKAIDELPSVFAGGAAIGLGAQVKYKDRVLSSTQVLGMTSNWAIIDGGSEINPGRSWTAAEAANGQRVTVINDIMATRLFGESEAIDKYVEISGQPFQVIGVFHYDASFLSGGDRPRAEIPIEAAIRHLHANVRQMALIVVPTKEAGPSQAMDDVTALMRARHRIRPGADNNFAIITQDNLMDVYNKIFGMFFLVMIALSAVGLIVGGVGVVAIMMISVTERTREIGVRKALGATRGAILWQFLVESVTLTSVGAIIGLIIGTIGSVIIHSATPIAASVPPMAVVAALGSSAVTGVMFGMIPAIRASRLDPVEALRYE